MDVFKIICIEKFCVFDSLNKFRNLLIMNFFIIILNSGLLNIHISKIMAKKFKRKFF